MVAIGLAMLGMVGLGWWLRRRGRLFETVWFLRLCQFAAPLGFLAVLSGWTVTEVGRQPWTVYGALRTAQFGLALADRLRRGVVVARLHGDLLIDVSGRIRGHGADGAAGLRRGRGAAAARSRASSRRRRFATPAE